MIKPWLLIFVLKKETLYLVVKEEVSAFHLPDYDFDINKDISIGKEGNYLFKNERFLKDARKFIRSRITPMEFFLSWRKPAVFISDRPLNNLAIKLFFDCAVILRCDKTRVYYDTDVPDSDILNYTSEFMHTIKDRNLIGKAGSFSAHYMEKDNSIKEAEQQWENINK